MGNYVRIGAVEGGDSKRSIRGTGETPLERELGGGDAALEGLEHQTAVAVGGEIPSSSTGPYLSSGEVTLVRK